MSANPGPCLLCGCERLDPAHRLLAALQNDDISAALAHGLLDAQPCPGCSDACNTRLSDARDARRFALAARERHRARAVRLERIAAARDAARRPVAEPVRATVAPSATLPPTAADALARALAKARQRHT